ncbi:MAG: histone deacetylase family protein [Gammaproteobacteria bacterium]|nr:histone deacetylase family protein [Gammaproteobacteria bacterium]
MTALFTHPDFLLHETPPGHPESPQRLSAVSRLIEASELVEKVERIVPELASNEELARVHDRDFVDQIASLAPTAGLVRVDADTSMGPNSLNASRRAVGAAVSAVRESLSGRHRRSFCVVRPPGHHAESVQAMGFCLFNSVAIAADYALDTVERVAVLDFDVHHGNGTVEMFADRPEVLVCSSFQFPFYPYRMQDIDRSNIVNTPLPAGTNGSRFREAIEQNWTQPLIQHRPDLILVSAGFDAHAEDPLAQLQLQDEDFRWISQWIVDMAQTYAKGRVVSTLEGGYDVNALARCSAIHLECLLD